jgi:tetratricopeptide (TPR) repeat protein
MRPSPSLVRHGLCLAVLAVFCQAALSFDDVDRRKLYAKTVRGCVGVMTVGGPASGWVVDVQKRWIVTCCHVVGWREEIDVVFPEMKDGRLVQERHYYVGAAKRVKAKVLSNDLKRDLCLLQVESLPPGTEAIRLASDSGQPGDNLNLIGNPAASGAMWNYTTGSLRAVYKKKFTYKNTSHEVDALVGETQLPANPGDSGGAVFNDRGEVVGVHSGGSPDAIQLMATYIDVTEVRAFLNEPFKLVAKLTTFDDFFNAGNDHLMRNEVDKAIEKYSQAIALKPDHSEAWRSRASAYIRKKAFDKAIEDCNQALKANKANAKAYNERAVAHGARGDLKAALSDYNEAVRLEPNDPMFWAGRAWTYNGLKEHNKAVSDANEALRLKNDFLLAYTERGLAYCSLKDYDLALLDLNQALKYQPNKVEALVYRGVAFAGQKKPSEAIKDFNEAIRINPQFATAYKERGTVHYFNTEYNLATRDFTQAIGLNPKDAQSYLWRSWCHKALGDQRQATADYDEAVRLNPTLGRPTADGQPARPKGE